MKFEYDVIVVGAGHAGCEAAVAAARLGCETLLITADMNRVAQMSCNPAIGGIAKGQIVREIDALGGMTGIIADRTAIQFRMLNRSKGPAVWSPRVQSDRTRFIDEWRKTLDETDRLHLFQDMVTEMVIDESKGHPSVNGVKTALGITFRAKRVVLTAGTFLNGLMHFGRTQIEGGRISEASSRGLSDGLRRLGVRVGRMKTGTPARIDGATIDYSEAIAQAGDDERMPDGSVKRDFHKFSYLPGVMRTLPPRDCYIVHTSPEVHQTLRDNLADSPLYNGQIKSIGPRYCPSIETKIVTFADKESHQLFLEPEGETTHEFYINGFSSSLPWQVQVEALTKIPALRDVQFYRPGYAIEYDFFDPTQMRHTLESKVVDNLFLAGQVNGTTGYEEAAAQGLMAGINAARSVKGLDPVVLGRDQAYIGVLIDDLVTKGVDEPYRMFTSRAEFRILLRQDDADLRLTPIGHEIGLADDFRYDAMMRKYSERDALVEWCEKTSIRPTDELQDYLEKAGTGRLAGRVKVADLLRRPQLDFKKLLAYIPILADRCSEVEEDRRDEIIESAEILIKYQGYIDRERESAERMDRLEKVRIPEAMNFDEILAISTEGRQKLSKIRPATIGQASRIPGVSPADINVLLVMIR
ncbi:MAG: tRNA uridine-5-carboxymethylaminomethyl(34) synthesis enzyme MnmG [Muribaculaceae bacterium]|nr:tRNA uridine-5-carboxymethylaminomethyl(34) synthesis enzyme MnmG [Muribaculaceae bacterium]